MMRDDRIGKILRAGRPEPTLTFTNRVRKAIDALPEQKKNSAMRFIPVSAVAVVAFAALCVFLVNYAGQANRPNGLFAAGGTETVQPSTASPEAGQPTSAAGDIVPSATPGVENTETAPTTSPESMVTAGPQSTDMPAPESTPEFTPSPIEAQCAGGKFFGYQANLNRVYENSGGIVVELDLADDDKGSLDKFISDNGNGKDIATFIENKPTHVTLAIGEGILDSKELELILAPHEGQEARDAFEFADERLSIEGLSAVLERGKNGRFTLSIICTNPKVRLDSGLTLISTTDTEAVYPDDSIDILYIQSK